MRRFLTLFVALAASLSAQDYVRYSAPAVFDYAELIRLGDAELAPELAAKLETLTTTPFVSNEAWLRGVRPRRPDIPGLGPSLRVVMWNIERGIRFEEIVEVFSDPDAFVRRTRNVGRRIDAGAILDQLDILSTADVLVLNEVDWGVKRSDYRRVAKELAEALDMNWAYGVEFIEIDPIQLGTEQFEGLEDEAERQEMIAEEQVDQEKIRALHGTAILSRYPIAEAKLIPFTNIGYDWFGAERESVSGLEKGKRIAAKNAFLEKIGREIRRGGRTALYATLDVPDLPDGKLTIAAPHLENRTDPKNRVKQMYETLFELSGRDHPVVVAGDFNTTFSDTSPTSIKREVYHTLGSSSFWAQKGIKYATGVGLAYDVLIGGFAAIKNYRDPTAEHVPIVAPNPERGLFDLLESFRFEDGTRFDFRGDKRRSVNKTRGTLGNSNQREKKGFAVTYAVERTIGPAGKLKLDWILVKSYIENARDTSQTYRFAPHFARTMEAINYSLDERLSDHNPISIDLPFGEPDIEN